ncbi:MAG: hypothetical protein FJ405_01290 [Verrucomicrobia bacterium]|nr:hypothetical protein [Verrucomicrobiota bacterium]
MNRFILAGFFLGAGGLVGWVFSQAPWLMAVLVLAWGVNSLSKRILRPYITRYAPVIQGSPEGSHEPVSSRGAPMTVRPGFESPTSSRELEEHVHKLG